MKFIVAVIVLIILASGVPVFATNYVEPADFKQWLISGKKMAVVDIQPGAEFAQHHFKGAIETNAFPGKTDGDKQRLDKVLPVIGAGTAAVVVVCPRGRGGAKNAYDYLKSKGVAEQRLFILEEGVAGWPYKELFVTGR